MSHGSRLLSAALLGACLLLRDNATATEAAATPKHWEHSLSAGVTINRGNKDLARYNASYQAKRMWEEASMDLQADLDYGKDDGEKILDRQAAKHQFNRAITKRLYWLLNDAYERDAVASLAYRLFAGPGLGYGVIRNRRTDVVIEAGLAYKVERYDGAGSASALAPRAAERLTARLSEHASLWQSLEYLGNAEESADVLLTAELGVKSTLVTRLGLKCYVRSIRNNRPAPGKGTSDTAIVTMLVYSF